MIVAKLWQADVHGLFKHLRQKRDLEVTFQLEVVLITGVNIVEIIEVFGLRN